MVCVCVCDKACIDQNTKNEQLAGFLHLPIIVLQAAGQQRGDEPQLEGCLLLLIQRTSKTATAAAISRKLYHVNTVFAKSRHTGGLMQKPHMANRAAIADCEFRGRGCGFVGLRGGGLGTVAAAGWWWRATVPRPRLARSLNPPVRPLCRLPLLAICGPAMCGNAAHTPPAKCWERLHCRKAQVGIFNIKPLKLPSSL